MDETELKNLLKSIGKGIFVRYFHEFGDSSLSNQDMVTLLQSEKSLRPKATATRIANARRIFHDGLEDRALSIIAESNRVPKAADEARTLLTELRSVRSGGTL